MRLCGWCAGMAPICAGISLTKLGRIKTKSARSASGNGARSLREASMSKNSTSWRIEERQELSNGTLHVDPLPEDNWTGPTGLHPQRAAGELPQGSPLRLRIAEFYMCGPR